MMFVQKNPNDERRRRLAEAMIQQGTSAAPVQHWLQGAARLAQAIAGRGQLNEIERKELERRQGIQDTFSKGIEAYKGTPAGVTPFVPEKFDETDIIPNEAGLQNVTQAKPGGIEALTNALMGNPDTAEFGANMMLTDLQNKSKLQQQRDLIDYKANSGGGIGTYNPRDYTTESWSNFLRTKKPDALVRYETSLQERLANVPGLSDRVSTTQAQIEGSKEQAKADVQKLNVTDVEFAKKLGTEGGNVYTKLQTAAQEASAFIPRLQSLKELSQKVRTGTGAEIKLIAQRALGVDTANMEVLNAKLGELAQDILNQQTGTKTDFDFENAVKQSASLGKTPEANAMLIDALIERQQQAVNFGDMARKAYDREGVRGVLDMRYSTTSQNADQPVTKVIGGKTYIKKSDGWYEQ